MDLKVHVLVFTHLCQQKYKFWLFGNIITSYYCCDTETRNILFLEELICKGL